MTNSIDTLQQAFAHAVALNPSQQKQYLQLLAQQDKPLYEQLLTLLKNDSSTDSFIHGPLDSMSKEYLVDNWVGRHIGAYEITEKVAVGGMGVVFKGKRIAEDFEQDVAIKIMNGVLSSKSMLQAFNTERQLFAQMQHPYIAQLYDGGATQDGVPYLIMEYIDGQPVDQYCDDRQLKTTERLQLFSKICEAVSYAHRNLVVHRDIKPSNVLVTASGIPKLLDFGIAKPLDAITGKQQGEVTHLGQRPLSPNYASPEQIQGEAITTGTDVYSLGVLLYKLLAGTLPFNTQGNNDALLKAICETTPLPPSAVKKPKDKNKKSGLSKELDAIVLKAMHKDVEHRYSSVQKMLEDIQRFCQGKPVQAKGDSIGYIASKFIQRHRWKLTVTGVVLIGFVVSFIATYQALQNEKQAIVLAQEETQKFKLMNDFILTMLTSVDPREKGDQVKVVDIIDRAQEDISTHFVEQPLIQAELMTTLGTSLSGLDYHKKAIALLESAHDIYLSQYGQNHLQTLTTANLILEAKAGYYPWQELLEQFEHLLPLAEQALGANHPLTMTLINNMAAMHLNLSYSNPDGQHLQIATQLLEALLAKRIEVLGKDAEDTSHARNNLSGAYAQLGRYQEALKLQLENYQIQKQIFGELNYYTQVTLHNIGRNYEKQKNYALAEEYMQRSYLGLQQIQDKGHRSTITALASLISVMVEQQKYQEVDELIQSHGIEIVTHPFFLKILSVSALDYIKQHYPNANQPE